MKEIKIIHKCEEHIVLIDDEDYDKIKDMSWYIVKGTNTFYAKHCQWVKDKPHNYVPMEKLIMGEVGTNVIIDHKNRNGLDNRKDNLRVATHKQNCSNRQKSIYTGKKSNTSQYKGVGWYKTSSKWRSRIKVDGKSKLLGYFETEIDAAKAYNIASKRYFGEYGYINDIVV